MIEISPKALRFARLAAEEQPRFSSHSQLSVIADKERDYRMSLANRPAHFSKYIQISNETAEFCLHAITSLLENESFFSSAEWDGNNFEFMKTISSSLSDKLQLSLSLR